MASTWVHTQRYSEDTTSLLTNTLSDDVNGSHQSKGAMNWVSGALPVKVSFANETRMKYNGDTEFSLALTAYYEIGRAHV